jgi:ketosteroid isomerase-like protein
MREIFSIALLILAITIMPVTATTKRVAVQKNAKIEQEIKKLEEENIDIWIKQDAARLENLLADNLIFTDLDGKIYDKAGLINLLKKDSYKLESATNTEFKVQVFGEIAVATFLTAGSGKMNAQQFKGQARYTDIWVKQKGQWKLAVGHASMVEGSLVIGKP